MFPIKIEGPCPALPLQQTTLMVRDDAAPCGLTRPEIEAIVHDFVARLGLPFNDDESYVISVGKLAVEVLGGKIFFRSYSGKGFESVLDVDGDRNFTIWLPDNSAPVTDRFIIGQAIGSYVLHYLLPRQNRSLDRPIHVNRWDNGPVGREQAWFAAELLMPATLVRHAFARAIGRQTSEPEDEERQETVIASVTRDLAQRFNVPEHIMRARLTGLRLTVPIRRPKKAKESKDGFLPTPFDMDPIP